MTTSDAGGRAASGAAPVVVGVDGGGTGSRAVVLDPGGTELAREVGSAAIVVPGAETASLEALRDLVRRALRRAGVEPARGALALVAGLAGVGREVDRARMETLLRSSGLASAVEVRNDAEVAVHDAFGEGPGILLVGGTGSIALARLPSGRWLRAGGWGALAGDEGSGWSLGLAAVRGVLRAMDGRGPATALEAQVTAALGTTDAPEIVDRLRTAAKGEVAALAPAVIEVADGGDPVARALVDGAARALADHLAPMVRAWRQEADDAPPPVALLGGLVVPGGPLRGRLLPLLEELGVAPLTLPPDPARGAAALARRLARPEAPAARADRPSPHLSN
jgi:N-acetylglucosamine kinase-like BadF-type ATPase